MRIAGVSFATDYRNKNNYLQINRQQRATNQYPAFKGQEYSYGITSCGVDGLNCDLTRDGKYVCSGTSGAGQQKTAAITNAIRNVYSGANMNITVIDPLSSSGILYIADPEENLSLDVYKKYDYVATEKQPNIPTIEDLEHKFHDVSNPINYNKKFGAVRDYYSRMLDADTAQLNKYKLKQIEDTENLQSAIENKCLAENQLRNDYNNNEARRELERQSYFIFINNEYLREDKEKIDYYESKNVATREKIEFLDNVVGIINKTGCSLMDRDILADNLIKDNLSLNSHIVSHIRISKEIEALRAEKICAGTKFEILQKEIKRLSNQSKVGNRNASAYLMEDNAPEYDPKNHRAKEISDIVREIKEINLRLHKLKMMKAQIENEIKLAKRDVAFDRQKLNNHISNLEPIYEELKAYYETKYPFDK